MQSRSRGRTVSIQMISLIWTKQLLKTTKGNIYEGKKMTCEAEDLHEGKCMLLGFY